mgnify:CR=1 FL=1
MSQKKVKGVKIYLSVKEIQIIEDLISSKAHFVGGFKKLKKSFKIMFFFLEFKSYL